jgi:hypothetical protein
VSLASDVFLAAVRATSALCQSGVWLTRPSRPDAPFQVVALSGDFGPRCTLHPITLLSLCCTDPLQGHHHSCCRSTGKLSARLFLLLNTPFGEFLSRAPTAAPLSVESERFLAFSSLTHWSTVPVAFGLVWAGSLRMNYFIISSEPKEYGRCFAAKLLKHVYSPLSVCWSVGHVPHSRHLMHFRVDPGPPCHGLKCFAVTF